MAKYLLSTKIYIYISLFACLFNLTTNNQEGNFYLTAFKKAWKFILNDTPNAKILAEKLKSEKALPLIFILRDIEKSGTDIFGTNTSQIFNFESTDNIDKFQPYDIIGVNDPGAEEDYLVIILNNTGMDNPGYKIGQLVNETYDLSEFNSAVMQKIAQGGIIPEETFILAYSDEEDEKEVEEKVEEEVEK